MSLCLSCSSDEHHCSHSCLGKGMRVGTQNTFVIIVHLWTVCIRDSFLFVSVYWWEQYHNTVTSGNRDNFGLCVCW